MTEEMQTEIEKRIEEAAWNFEGDVNVGRDCYNCNGYSNGLTEGFYEGAKFILEMPEFEEAIEAAQAYLNFSPVDGWHFSDCDASEDNYDDEMPCSCGVGVKEINLINALKKLKALGIVKEGEK